MVRVMVCFMIVLLSAAGGYIYSWRFARRIMIIKDAKEKFNIMEREIMFSMDTIPDICRKLEEDEGAFARVFERINEEIGMAGDSFGELWRKNVKAVLSGSSLKKEQLEALALLGRGLGKGDLEEQKKCFARINSELDDILSEADEECKRSKKMYMSLFTSGGMALAIILI